MKNKLFIILALFCSLQAWAQEGGIQFQKDAKWNDLLAKAKAENKLIFMDAYAVWCGPCKMMDSKVFSQAEAGTFFNANFVNAKFDMEKGEGLELAKTYEVQAYPTLLFIDGDGKIAHRIVGYHELEEFMELSKVALDPNKRFSAQLARYESGERDPAFLNEFVEAADAGMYSGTADVAIAYLNTQNDWSTSENRQFIVSYTKNSDSKLFEYFVKNYDSFVKEFGKTAVVNKLQEVILTETYAKNPSEQFVIEKLLPIYQAKLPAAVADELYLLTKMQSYQMQNDTKNFFATTLEYYKKYPSNDFQELNEQAWAFYELVDDKKMLQEALKWAQKSVQLNSQSFNNDTLAALYYKLGEKKKVKKTAEKAIELAKANGEDYAATQELLDKINKM